MVDILDKPPKRKWLFLRKYLWIILFSILGIALTTGGYSEGQRYQVVQQKAVTVTAEVTHYEEDWDSENGKEYDTYMSYSYNGHTYTKHYKTYGSERKAAAVIGKTLQLQINPEKPSEQVEDVQTNSAAMYIFGAWLLGLSVLFCGVRQREYYTTSFGWLRRNVEADLKVLMRGRASAWLFCFIAAVVLAGAWYVHRHAFVAIAAGVFLVIGIIYLPFWLRSWRLVRNGDFHMSNVVLVDKKEKSDSEGGTNYLLYFSDCGNSFKRHTNRRQYNVTRIGDLWETVYLGRGKRPIFMYSKTSKTMF